LSADPSWHMIEKEIEQQNAVENLDEIGQDNSDENLSRYLEEIEPEDEETKRELPKEQIRYRLSGKK